MQKEEINETESKAAVIQVDNQASEAKSEKESKVQSQHQKQDSAKL